jgi:hypothetical protein
MNKLTEICALVEAWLRNCYIEFRLRRYPWRKRSTIIFRYLRRCHSDDGSQVGYFLRGVTNEAIDIIDYRERNEDEQNEQVAENVKNIFTS